jgi:hypothetical protein
MLVTANFELASKAITIARAAVGALEREEETTRFTELQNEWFRCGMCPPGVHDLVFEDLVSMWHSVLGGRPRANPACAQLRHCQRHPTQVITHTGRNGPLAQLKEPARRLRSFAELRSGKYRRQVMRHQFACAHCRFHNTQTRAGAAPTWVEVEIPKRLDFNAVRSHLKARYGPTHSLITHVSGLLMHRGAWLGIRFKMCGMRTITGCPGTNRWNPPRRRWDQRRWNPRRKRG